MQDSPGTDTRIALDLALTVRHDGHGGIADDLADPAGLTAWVSAHPGVLPDAADFAADASALAAVRDVRAATRA
ncbi:ABATE domain-containing protein, partial [Streptomyces sp. NPDC005549]|uniref:ABATE domain-containing protein n=1 Tax=Streptomyces sp. NPDC005549 TaxID=3154888 RepID=UPI0033A97B7D